MYNVQFIDNNHILEHQECLPDFKDKNAGVSQCFNYIIRTIKISHSKTIVEYRHHPLFQGLNKIHMRWGEGEPWQSGLGLHILTPRACVKGGEGGGGETGQ